MGALSRAQGGKGRSTLIFTQNSLNNNNSNNSLSGFIDKLIIEIFCEPGNSVLH